MTSQRHYDASQYNHWIPYLPCFVYVPFGLLASVDPGSTHSHPLHTLLNFAFYVLCTYLLPLVIPSALPAPVPEFC